MQIVIPMSGFGERFRKVGYKVPKPLIEVDGLPIIAHVINMFPGENNFIFICNEQHLDHPDYNMTSILNQYCPSGKIIAISAHKLGPVYAVTQAFDEIDDQEDVVVNYCDFTCDWDFTHFKGWIEQVAPDGCIPAYRGFHPHSLGSTYYAYVKQTKLWAEDIQEKQPYTENPMDEFASSGTYYFRTGKLLKHYFMETIKRELQVNSEYYVSMVYLPMLQDHLKIAIYQLNHFMQWGTPADLQEYQVWSRIFQQQASDQTKEAHIHPGVLLIPMVGLGSRFAKAGYENIKPLIPVSGKPMYSQAVSCLPQMENRCFVLRTDNDEFPTLKQHVETNYEGAQIITTDQLTEGQASSCMLAESVIIRDKPLLISACDHGLFYNKLQYDTLMKDDKIDIIVWAIKNYANAKRYPHMYGWIKTANDTNVIESVSVKKAIGDTEQTPIILGTFTFKKGEMFTNSAQRLFAKNDRVNGEFYVDSCINHAIALGYRCAVFEVDSYIGWGTPEDLKSFEYWQGCFHYWPYHPYSIDSDLKIPSAQKKEYINRYKLERSPLPDGIASYV